MLGLPERSDARLRALYSPHRTGEAHPDASSEKEDLRSGRDYSSLAARHPTMFNEPPERYPGTRETLKVTRSPRRLSPEG